MSLRTSGEFLEFFWNCEAGLTMSTPNNVLYEFGPFLLDKTERLLLREGVPIQLTLKAFDTLVVLVESSGHVVNKDELMSKVWPDAFIGDNTLASNISYLRKALGADGQFIETVPKVGYRFGALVTRVAAQASLRAGIQGTAGIRESGSAAPDPDPDQAKERGTDRLIVAETKEVGLARTEECVGAQTDQQVPQRSMRDEESGAVGAAEQPGSRANKTEVPAVLLEAPKPSPRLALTVAGFIGVALLGAASIYVLGFRRGTREGAPASSRSGLALRSLAVLPFNQLNPDSGQEFLGLGMADSLITRLSSTRQVAVRPTSSINKYDGASDRDPVRLGREMGVDSVLDGTIQRSGDRVRVTVRLWSTEERRPVWAGEFDEKFTEMFSVEDSISEKVATALALKLSGEDRKLLLKHYTDNAAAYQAYVKGRYHWSRWTPEEVRKAIVCFQEAIKVDPNYSLAYAGLADSYNVMGTFGYVAPQEAWPETEAAANKALALDEGLAEAHSSLGGAKMVYDWDWRGAEYHFKRGIDLAPDSPNAHQVYGLYLMAMDRRDEALREMRLAQQLDPSSPLMTTSLGWALLFARQYDASIVELRKALDLDPNYQMARGSLELAFNASRKFDDMISLSESERAAAKARGERWASANLVYAYAQMGRKAQALQIAEDLREMCDERYISPFVMATAYIGLGDKDEAFKWLDKAYEERSNFLWLLKVYPYLDSLRSDPRFADLLRRVGLEG
jgi:DNA-binding winged helix-turn-helix (wHTH) protein/TolB-like protein/Tfp pilus assembly protein PilF